MTSAPACEVHVDVEARGRWGYSVRVDEVLDCWMSWTVYDGAAWTLRGAHRKARRHLRRYLRAHPPA